MSVLAILINIALVYLAFHFARNGESVIGRILGLGFLISRGGMLLLLGSLSDKGVVPLLLGTVMLVLAGVAWFQGRS